MQNYIINEETLVLKANNKKTEIIEKNCEFIVAQQILSIIDESCKYYGSSLKGRREGSNYLLGNNYKVPIIIDEYQELIFFPTSSYKKEDIIWINYYYIDKYYGKDNNTIIIFKNNKKISFNISNKIINNQILKSSRLESILKSKKR